MEYTKEDFNHVFFDERFEVPIRWDGKDFYKTLSDLYDSYSSAFSDIFYAGVLRPLYPKIRGICNGILEAIKEYLNGNSSSAFQRFNDTVFWELENSTLNIYNGHPFDSALDFRNGNKSKIGQLYRVRKVPDNRIYAREEIFHTPFCLRSKVATNRYSIAGYPSLYLSTSVDLCLEELDYSRNLGRYIAARFAINGSENKIKILELGIKPSDFKRVPDKMAEDPKKYKRQSLLKDIELIDSKTIENYFLWYPLILACSFIRINKEDPFSIEYIIPQLLMQSIKVQSKNIIIGIRYFSCSSVLASDMGFNYVFPTLYSGGEELFCSTLKKVFPLTAPLYLNEYTDNRYLETALKNKKVDFIV